MTDFAAHPILQYKTDIMGRVKLKIKRLENNNGRQSTYAKRKNGIIKKANELSILCDIDILLIMFSPSGKPTLCKGKNSSIGGVIEKFSQLTPQERAKRKLESLEALKKTFKKLDHDVNIQDFIGTSYQSVEDLNNQAKLLRTQLSEVQKHLSYWTNPDKINSIEQLAQMEDSLRKSLNQIQTHKDDLEKQSVLALGCTNQFQNGMQLPFSSSPEQQLQVQPLSWIPNDDSQPMVLLHEDPNLFPKREMEYSAGTSIGSFSGQFCEGEKVDIATASTRQEIGFINELTRTEAVLQPYAQYPYPPYNFSFICDKRFQPEQQLNLQGNTEYCFDGNFEPPQSGYDTNHCNWASTLVPCAVAPFDERLFSQQYCSSDDRVAKEIGHMNEKPTHQPSLTN